MRTTSLAPLGRPRRRRRLAAAALALLIAGGFLGLLQLRGLRDHLRPRVPLHEQTYFSQGESARLSGDYDAAIEAYGRSVAAAPHDPRPYYWLVESYARQGELEAVEPVLRSMLAADPKNAAVHYGLGCLAVKRQDLSAALVEARRAIALDPHLGHARLLLGSAHYYAGRPREALKAWQDARRFFRRQGDREYEAWALNRMALVHRELAEFRRALVLFRDALAVQRDLGNRPTQHLILGNMGLTQADLGELGQAMASLGEALAMAREVGDQANECWHLTNLSFVYDLVGRYGEAAGYADSAVGLAHRMGSPEDEVSGWLCRANASVNQGDPLASLEACRRALSLSQSLADVRHQAGVRVAMGRAYLELGQLERALENYAVSDSLFRQIGVASGSWEALLGLCQIAMREGDTTNAMARAERTREECSRAGYAEGEELLTLQLCDWSRKRGDLTRALTLASQALTSSRRDGRRQREALALVRCAEIRLALGDLRGARSDARQAREIAVALRSPEILWQCEMAVGEVAARTHPARALEHYAAAMNAVESIQRKLRLEEFKAGYLESRLEPYRRATDLLVDRGRPGEALAVSERSRARALRDLLAASPTPVAPQVPESLATRSRAADEKLRTLRATLSAVASASGSDRGRIRALEREVARARADWDELQKAILLQDPRYGATLPEGSFLDTTELLRALAPEEAVLEYVVGPNGCLCFVAAQGRIQAVRLEVGSSALAGEIAALRRPLAAPRSLAALSYAAAQAESLRQELFDPVAPYLRGVRRLFIVPDGPLHCLPFEALVVAPPGPARADTLYASFRHAEFLDDQYAIVYLPAASLLVSTPLRLRRPGSLPEPRSLLALGNPAAADTIAGPPEPKTETGEEPETRSAELHHSEQEVRAISRLFPDAVTQLGPEATELNFKALAPGFRYLHLSSHGAADPTVPLYSGLALAPDATGREDGYLHAYEVLCLPLSCDLVTLSACDTGIGPVYSGEGMLGLTRSFLYAGARQVLVSLWNVNDASTAMLMERFYRNLTQGMDAVEALQQAKKTLRAAVVLPPGSPPMSYAHPFFWAAFVLVGVPG